MTTSPRSIVIEPHSIASAVVRVIEDAVISGRMSKTEAAVIRDFLAHDHMSAEFLRSVNEGGYERQERF